MAVTLDNTKNFAKVTVSTGYDASATSIVLTGGHGAKLPTASFNAVWWNSTDYADPADDPNVEIVRVTAIVTDTLTVTRAQESTSATTKNTSGKTYKMIAGLTAKVLNNQLAQELTTTSAPTFDNLLLSNSNANTSPIVGLKIYNSGTTTGNGSWVLFDVNRATPGQITVAAIGGVGQGDINMGEFAIYTRNTGSLIERVRVDESGRVGIATTDPGELLDLGLAGTTGGALRLAGLTSGNVTIKVASIAGSWTLTLPTSTGLADQFLQTNGTGASTWATPVAKFG